MTSYAARGAALDRFLADHDVEPEDVLGADIAYSRDGVDIHLHAYRKLTGLDYQKIGKSSHFYALVEREDLVIRIVYAGDKAVAA